MCSPSMSRWIVSTITALTSGMHSPEPREVVSCGCEGGLRRPRFSCSHCYVPPCCYVPAATSLSYNTAPRGRYVDPRVDVLKVLEKWCEKQISTVP